MDYETIKVAEAPFPGILTITLDRVQAQNSINDTLLIELNRALDRAEQESFCSMVVVQGQQGLFCTGMDFDDVAAKAVDHEEAADAGEYRSGPGLYMQTIKRLAAIPLVTVALVDGRAMAGGLGLVAASDLAIATPRAQFSLSEALWGLLPAMVLPYLIRRVGFQVAYRMTLTTMPLSAGQALDVHLVDEVSDQPTDTLKRLWLRLSKLESDTLADMKAYFRKMWLVTDRMEEEAVAETVRLTSSPKVVDNIVNYVKYKKFPWDDR